MKYIKTNRMFTSLRKYGWMFTVLIAIGGRWEPKFGLAVLAVMLGLTVTSFFRGRYWCGNICPHGSLFDSLLPLSKNQKIPNFLKSKTAIVGFMIFFMVNIGSKVANISSFWGSYDFLDKLGYIFSNTYLMVMIVGGLLAIFVTPRTWCQFCPMGTMQKVSHFLGDKLKISQQTNKLITIESKDKCISCGKCEKVCPFQLSPYKNFNENNQFDDINCIQCSTCVVNCPLKILSLENERSGNECQADQVNEDLSA